MVNSTCYKCEERYVGCHSQCTKYTKFKKDVEEDKAKINASKEIRMYVMGEFGKNRNHYGYVLNKKTVL